MMKFLLAWVANLAAIIVFLFSCFVAASDGQGAILFIFTFPALFLLLYGVKVLTRQNGIEANNRWKNAAYWTSRAILVFALAFLLCAFIPGLNIFTSSVINGVSVVFQSVTGKTPYVWVREQNHLSVKVAKALEKSSGQELDLREMNGSYQWDSVCFLSPHATDEEALKILQLSYDWKLSEHRKVVTSESDNLMIFLYQNHNRGVSYVVELNRNQADFSKLYGQCIAKANAHLVKVPGTKNEFQIAGVTK